MSLNKQQQKDLNKAITAIKTFGVTLVVAREGLKHALEDVNLYQIACDIPMTYNANFAATCLMNNAQDTIESTNLLVRDLSYSLPKGATSNKTPPKKETK